MITTINLNIIKEGVNFVFQGKLSFNLERIDESIDSYRDFHHEISCPDFSYIKVFANYDDNLILIPRYRLTEKDEFDIVNSVDMQNLPIG